MGANLRSATRRRPSTRTPMKQNEILGTLRRQIVQGTYPPGARLPLRSEIQAHFGVSTATVQGALNRLIADGFVQAQGRLGTYVTANPPHLCHYGLLFPGTPSVTQLRSRVWTALSNEAAGISQTSYRRVHCYYGADGHADSEISNKVINDMRQSRLAGLILAFFDNNEISGSPLVDEPGIPRVRITVEPGPRGIPGVCLDLCSFIDKALDYLLSRKRKRIACLTVAGLQQSYIDYLHAGIERRKMQTRTYWTHSVQWPDTQWARPLTQLLMNPDQKTRPDGLIILDDNIVEHVTAGLVAQHVHVPEDCDVVAYSNFPWSPPGVLPLKYLGFDVRELLRYAIEAIDLQRRSLEAPAVKLVKAKFEEELDKSSPDEGSAPLANLAAPAPKQRR
jgi:DNA-binding LacI/PurR family transcriptional regulator